MLKPGALVLYKTQPAVLRAVRDKLEIELDGGENLRVREKDILVLHPGPVASLDVLEQETATEYEEAWRILSGETTTLAELTELACGAFTPQAAWAVWERVAEDLHFTGSPDALTARSQEDVDRRNEARETQKEAQLKRAAFLDRMKKGRLSPEDEPYLRDVLDLALGRGKGSRTLRSLGRSESIENAHALLLEAGIWDDTMNPYPRRLGLETLLPEIEVPALRDERRKDLTHLAAYAIDDEGAATPDDALSFEHGAIWVHVADPAAVVLPGDPLDREARARGATLHVPEAAVHMLPQAAIDFLGLGLAEISPALSFKLSLDQANEPNVDEIVASWIRVERLTYDQADRRIAEGGFAGLLELTLRYQQRREALGAIAIDLPEASVHVDSDGLVSVRPLPAMSSRRLVQESMIMAGEAFARWAIARQIAVPFTTQDAQQPSKPVQEASLPRSMAAMWNMRRALKRSTHTTAAGPHAGLGLPCYVQVTSPLRRYLDLLVHQQIRAVLEGRDSLDIDEIVSRMGEAEAILPAVRRAERLSERHWTLVYLRQNPTWEGQAVVVGKRETTHILVIPELAFETKVATWRPLAPDDVVTVEIDSVSLPFLEANFLLGKDG